MSKLNKNAWSAIAGTIVALAGITLLFFEATKNIAPIMVGLGLGWGFTNLKHWRDEK